MHVIENRKRMRPEALVSVPSCTTSWLCGYGCVAYLL